MEQVELLEKDNEIKHKSIVDLEKARLESQRQCQELTIQIKSLSSQLKLLESGQNNNQLRECKQNEHILLLEQQNFD